MEALKGVIQKQQELRDPDSLINRLRDFEEIDEMPCRQPSRDEQQHVDDRELDVTPRRRQSHVKQEYDSARASDETPRGRQPGDNQRHDSARASDEMPLESTPISKTNATFPLNDTEK